MESIHDQNSVRVFSVSKFASIGASTAAPEEEEAKFYPASFYEGHCGRGALPTFGAAWEINSILWDKKRADDHSRRQAAIFQPVWPTDNFADAVPPRRGLFCDA